MSDSDNDTMTVADGITQLDALSDSLAALETHLTPLLSMPLQSVTAQLPPLQSAKLQAALSYATSALYFIYLHTTAEDAAHHPIKKELERVKKYLKKVQDATTESTADAAASASSTTTTASSHSRVDKAAAKRFISHQLAGQTHADTESAKKQMAGKRKTIEKEDGSATNAISFDDSSSEDEEIASANASSSQSKSQPASSSSNPTQAARIAANQASPATKPTKQQGSQKNKKQKSKA